MLLKLSDIVREAQDHAINCVEQADKASSPEAEEDWRRLERGWVRLAESYLLVDSLQRYLFDVDQSNEPGTEPLLWASRAAETGSSASESKYRLFAEECRRKSEAEPTEYGKRRWADIAADWHRLAERKTRL